MNVPAGTGNGRTLTPARVMSLDGVTAVTLRAVPASRWLRVGVGMTLLVGTLPPMPILLAATDDTSGQLAGLLFGALAGAWMVVTGLRLRAVHWVLVTQGGREVALYASTDEAAARAVYAEAAAAVR